MNRVRVKFRPVWAGSVEGWTVNYINRHLWKLQPDWAFDDVYQEAYIVFMDCVDRYPHVVDPPHFMSLYSRSISNWIIDEATRRTKKRTVFSPQQEVAADGEGVDIFDLVGTSRDESDYLLMCLSAEMGPEPVKRVVEHLKINGGAPSRYGSGKRQTTNEWLCGIAGVDPESLDIVSLLKSFLLGDGNVQTA